METMQWHKKRKEKQVSEPLLHKNSKQFKQVNTFSLLYARAEDYCNDFIHSPVCPYINIFRLKAYDSNRNEN